MFGLDTPVLAPERADFRGSVRWILWPALQFRVITPLVQEQRTNALQKAVLGLCQCGLRDPEELGGLLGISGKLVELVLADLHSHRYVTEHHAVTDLGEQTLRDGYLDPSRTVVTHVYQDPFHGNLWSGALTSPQWIEARWQHARLAQLTLGSAGEPIQNRHALAIQYDHTNPPAPPYPEEVVAAVLRAERAARTGKQRRGAERNPPERVTRRVSMISDHPVAVYLPVAVLATGGANAAGPGMTTWLAMSPFTGRQSAFARHLVATRYGEREDLRLVVEKVLGRSVGSLLAETERLAVEKRRVMEEAVERRFSSRVRAHRGLFELLTLLEYHAVDTGAAHQRTEERETVVRYAWRCCEYILRRVVRDNPVELPRRSRRLRQLPERTRAEKTEFQHLLATAAMRLGLNYGDAREIDMVERSAVSNAMVRADRATAPVLIAATVFSAAHQPETHPLAAVARSRPRLIVELFRLSKERNESAHGAPADLHSDLAAAARSLAHDLATAFLKPTAPTTDSSVLAERERTLTDA